MGSDTCAYPRDTEGAHDHADCQDALLAQGASFPCTWQRPDGRRCTQAYDHQGRCTFPAEVPA